MHRITPAGQSDEFRKILHTTQTSLDNAGTKKSGLAQADNACRTTGIHSLAPKIWDETFVGQARTAMTALEAKHGSSISETTIVENSLLPMQEGKTRSSRSRFSAWAVGHTRSMSRDINMHPFPNALICTENKSETARMSVLAFAF